MNIFVTVYACVDCAVRRSMVMRGRDDRGPVMVPMTLALVTRRRHLSSCDNVDTAHFTTDTTAPRLFLAFRRDAALMRIVQELKKLNELF